MDDKLVEYGKNLHKSIWITKSSRFQASRRLNTQSQLSITSISLLSIYAIAISIIQNIVDSTRQCNNLNNLYTITAILLSVFILVLSLLEGLKNYQLRAERLDNNAQELSKLNRKIDYFLSSNLDNTNNDKSNNFIKNIQNSYDDLVDRCQENHDTDDYWLFKANRLKDFPKEFKNIYCLPTSYFRAWWIQLSYLIKYYLFYMLFIVFPIPVFYLLYSTFKC